MRLLLDTNILLDVFLEREPFVRDAKRLWQAQRDGRISACIVATTVTNLFYIARRAGGTDRARMAVRLSLQTFELISVDRLALEYADSMPGADLEDNLQAACVTLYKLDGIVTRDARFAGIEALTPTQVLERLGS